MTPKKGAPIDALDTTCKKYKDCLKCARMNHGDVCIGEFHRYAMRINKNDQVSFVRSSCQMSKTLESRSSAATQPAHASVLYVSAMLCSLKSMSPRLTRTLMTTTCSTRKVAGIPRINASPVVAQLIQSAVAIPTDRIHYSMAIIHTRNAALMAPSRPSVLINLAINKSTQFSF